MKFGLIVPTNFYLIILK